MKSTTQQQLESEETGADQSCSKLFLRDSCTDFEPFPRVSQPVGRFRTKTFLYSFYKLRGRLHQPWIVPRFGFQYFLPLAAKGINQYIEEAILRANRLGVKVISLVALNKNEALNGGGTLFVDKHLDLKVRVVHGKYFNSCSDTK